MMHFSRKMFHASVVPEKMARNVFTIRKCYSIVTFNKNIELILENINNSYLLHDENSASFNGRLHLNNTCILKLKKREKKNKILNTAIVCLECVSYIY